MKVKVLRRKDTKYFVGFDEYNYSVFESDIPYIFLENVTFESLKKDKGSYGDADFDNLELIDFDLVESNQIGADIRNKLSSPKNLIALLERQKQVDDVMKQKIQIYIDKEIEQAKKSIDYLTNLL